MNAYLKDHDTTALSLEYAILGLLSPDYKIEQWTPINSLTWGKAMAWDLRGNMDEEIERAILLKTLTPEQVAELYPAYPQDHPVIVNQIGEWNFRQSVRRRQSAFDIPAETLSSARSITSRFWTSRSVPQAMGLVPTPGRFPARTPRRGMPLLANDPHLGIQMPSIWYQAHLECKPVTDECPYDVAES